MEEHSPITPTGVPTLEPEPAMPQSSSSKVAQANILTEKNLAMLEPSIEGYEGGATDVYHINPGPGTFTTRKARHLRTGEWIADQATHSDEEHDRPLSLFNEDLAQAMVLARATLKAAGHMTLDRAQSDLRDCKCGYPECTMRKNTIFGGQLYLRVTTLGGKKVVLAYHLACLEELWNGKGFEQPLPDPEVDSTELPVRSLIRALNGLGKTESKQDARQRGFVNEGTIGFVTQRPLRRFQYLAVYIALGPNLTKHETKYVKRWQKSTETQMEICEYAHRQGTRRVGGEKSSEPVPDVKLHEKMADCFGKNLSEVMELAW